MKLPVLREYRKKLGLSLEEVAKGICSLSTLSRIERGDLSPSLPLLTKLCERLSCSIADLEEKEEENAFSSILDNLVEMLTLKEFEAVIRVGVPILKNKTLQNFPQEISEIHRILGNAFTNLGDLEKAKEHYQKQLGIALQHRLLLQQLKAHNNMSHYYHSVKDIKKAQEHYEEAYHLSHTVTLEPRNQITLLYNLARIHIKLGDDKKALRILKQSLYLSDRTGIYAIATHITNTIGLIQLRERKYKEAIHMFNKGLHMAEFKDDKYHIVTISLNIARVSIRVNNKEQALFYYKKAIELMQDIQDDELETEISEILIEMEQKWGGFNDRMVV